MQPNQSISCDNANVVKNINNMIMNVEKNNEDLENNMVNTRKGHEGWDPWHVNLKRPQEYHYLKAPHCLAFVQHSLP